jgi:hypothetical protein
MQAGSKKGKKGSKKKASDDDSDDDDSGSDDGGGSDGSSGSGSGSGSDSGSDSDKKKKKKKPLSAKKLKAEDEDKAAEVVAELTAGGTEEMIKIFCKTSRRRLQVVAKAYKESAGEPLEKLVKKLSSSSSDLKVYSRWIPPSYTPLIHSSQCTPLIHSSHILSHTLLSYTPLIHPLMRSEGRFGGPVFAPTNFLRKEVQEGDERIRYG